MNRGRGSILVLVLFVLTVLSVLAVSYAYRTGLEHRASRHRLIRAQLRAQAESALAIAAARLTENTNGFDHLGEPWHSHEPLHAEGWLPELTPDRDGDLEYTADYVVVDEESKLHVLAASSQSLERLGMTPEQIDALADWVDEDDHASPSGAESDEYLRFAVPYRAKNKTLELIEELRQIRGFSSTDIDGEDANHNRLLDPSEDDGPLSWPADDADGRLKLGFCDLLTCVGDRKLNINTAPRDVLSTLRISDRAVDQILAFRRWDRFSRKSLDEHVFQQPADIDDLQGLEDAEREVLKAACVFKSRYFRVHVWCEHKPSGLMERAEALLRMDDDGPHIVMWRTGA